MLVFGANLTGPPAKRRAFEEVPSVGPDPAAVSKEIVEKLSAQEQRLLEELNKTRLRLQIELETLNKKNSDSTRNERQQAPPSPKRGRAGDDVLPLLSSSTDSGFEARGGKGKGFTASASMPIFRLPTVARQRTVGTAEKIHFALRVPDVRALAAPAAPGESISHSHRRGARRSERVSRVCGCGAKA